MRLVQGTLLAFVLSLSGHAAAHTGARTTGPKHLNAPKPEPEREGKADPEGEGPSVDPNERLFAALDVNHDGVVSQDELWLQALRSMQQRVKVRFSRLDVNHDGRVTPNEVIGMDPRRFARFDINEDGAFTAVELAQVLSDTLARRVRQVFASMDVDGDGACTGQELRRHRVAMAERAARRAEKVAATRPAPRRF